MTDNLAGDGQQRHLTVSMELERRLLTNELTHIPERVAEVHLASSMAGDRPFAEGRKRRVSGNSCGPLPEDSW